MVEPAGRPLCSFALTRILPLNGRRNPNVEIEARLHAPPYGVTSGICNLVSVCFGFLPLEEREVSAFHDVGVLPVGAVHGRSAVVVAQPEGHNDIHRLAGGAEYLTINDDAISCPLL